MDLLLVIALDVSGSVDKGEFDLQREGLTRALASPQVAKAIVGGVNGSIAITATTSTLAGYYRDKVIGGAGAFVESVADYCAFETAMLRKLVREIGGRFYSAGADQLLPVISASSTSFL